MRCKNGWAGFTLVELLVVIAIIGMLVGLLLPAVQQAREAARQLQCNNHLRQMALACLNHESQQNAFPSGGWYYTWYGDPDMGLGPSQPGGWPFSLLPFMEQMALFQYASDGDVRSAASSEQKSRCLTVAQTPLSIFYCPSRRTNKNYPLSTGVSNCNSISSGAKTDYAANWGSSADYADTETAISGTTPAGDLGWKMRDLIASGNYLPSSSTGTIYRFSAVSSTEIYDGMSNTYLIGEKYIEPNYYELVTISDVKTGTDDNGLYAGMDYDTERTAGSLNRNDFSKSSTARRPMQDRAGAYVSAYRFGSAHAGTFGMAMCDGSVHRISYSIDYLIHMFLAARDDGQPATLP